MHTSPVTEAKNFVRLASTSLIPIIHQRGLEIEDTADSRVCHPYAGAMLIFSVSFLEISGFQ